MISVVITKKWKIPSIFQQSSFIWNFVHVFAKRSSKTLHGNISSTQQEDFVLFSKAFRFHIYTLCKGWGRFSHSPSFALALTLSRTLSVSPKQTPPAGTESIRSFWGIVIYRVALSARAGVDIFSRLVRIICPSRVSVPVRVCDFCCIVLLRDTSHIWQCDCDAPRTAAAVLTSRIGTIIEKGKP